MDSIMRTFGKNSQTGIDYESLMSLSQGSGLEAIRTMTDLSERVSIRSASSHGSVESPGRQRSSRKRRGESSRSSSTSSKASKASKSRPKLSKAPKATQEPHSGRGSMSRHHPKDTKRTSSSQSPRGGVDSLGRRQSMLTTSSDSTKLGEIRHRENLREAQATYPLWSYPREPVKLKKGKLFGLFGR